MALPEIIERFDVMEGSPTFQQLIGQARSDLANGIKEQRGFHTNDD